MHAPPADPAAPMYDWSARPVLDRWLTTLNEELEDGCAFAGDMQPHLPSAPESGPLVSVIPPGRFLLGEPADFSSGFAVLRSGHCATTQQGEQLSQDAVVSRDANDMSVLQPYGGAVGPYHVSAPLPEKPNVTTACEQLGPTYPGRYSLEGPARLPVAPTCLFVQNLPRGGDDQLLFMYRSFSPYGAVESCKVFSRGVGFVSFVHRGDAINAQRALHSTVLPSGDTLFVALLPTSTSRLRTTGEQHAAGTAANAQDFGPAWMH